jgi:hypothetical protein
MISNCGRSRYWLFCTDPCIHQPTVHSLTGYQYRRNYRRLFNLSLQPCGTWIKNPPIDKILHWTDMKYLKSHRMSNLRGAWWRPRSLARRLFTEVMQRRCRLLLGCMVDPRGSHASAAFRRPYMSASLVLRTRLHAHTLTRTSFDASGLAPVNFCHFKQMSHSWAHSISARIIPTASWTNHPASVIPSS